MEFLKKLYPRRAKAQEKDTLVKAIVFYAIGIVAVMVISFIIGFVAGLLLGELAWIVTGIVGLIGTVVEIYCTGGIVVSILSFLNVIKE